MSRPSINSRVTSAASDGEHAGGVLRRFWSLPAWVGRRGVMFIDGILLRHYGVETFSDDPRCILRFSLRRLEKAVTLAEGTELGSGDKLIELHFWNEHLPLIGDNGADILWGREFAAGLIHSLHLLAAWAPTDPRCEGFVAAHGQLGFLPGNGVDSLKGLAQRFGFILELRAEPRLRFWTGAFWAGLYAWWLMWTFNPNTLRRKRLREMSLSDLWMTSETLMDRYGPERSRHDAHDAYRATDEGKPSPT